MNTPSEGGGGQKNFTRNSITSLFDEEEEIYIYIVTLFT